MPLFTDLYPELGKVLDETVIRAQELEARIKRNLKEMPKPLTPKQTAERRKAIAELRRKLNAHLSKRGDVL